MRQLIEVHRRNIDFLRVLVPNGKSVGPHKLLVPFQMCIEVVVGFHRPTMALQTDKHLRTVVLGQGRFDWKLNEVNNGEVLMEKCLKLIVIVVVN